MSSPNSSTLLEFNQQFPPIVMLVTHYCHMLTTFSVIPTNILINTSVLTFSKYEHSGLNNLLSSFTGLKDVIMKSEEKNEEDLT